MDFINDIKDHNSRLSKELRNFQEKTRLHNLIITSFLLVVFLILPICLLVFKNLIGINTNTSDAFALTIGAVDRDLLIGFNQ